MNFYNEFDPKAAAWLRELIKVGEIPDGVVDERSITEIKPHELAEYTQCHFFAGIGGWSLALKLAGWPADKPVWTGSCPCQPFSAAGKQLGDKDERHLWPAFFNLIRECCPEYVFGEQVANAIGKGWLDGISADLEAENYACGAIVLGAHSLGAPHIRQRLYWVALATMPRCSGTISESEGDSRDETRMCVLGENSGPSSVAVADGGDTSPEREQRSGEHGQQQKDGGVNRMEYPESNRREQWRTESSGRSVTSRRELGPLVNPEQPGLEGLTRNGDNGSKPGRIDAEQDGSIAATSGAWGDFQLLPCTDGKARRIEPESFPLAHGVSGRVGLLRGYGNAIVPQVAAAFIEASVEAISGSMVTEAWL